MSSEIALTLSELDMNDLIYRGEGNLSLVVSLKSVMSESCEHLIGDNLEKKFIPSFCPSFCSAKESYSNSEDYERPGKC